MTSNTEIRALERILATLLNKQLQNICATNGLRTGGVKAELQTRIKDGMSLPHPFRYIFPYFSIIPAPIPNSPTLQVPNF